MLSIENPGLCTAQEGGNDDGSVYLDLCREAKPLFDSLPKDLLALDKRLSRSLLAVASLEMTLPRQVKCSTAFRLLPSMLMLRGTVCLSWRGLVQHLSLLQADGEAKVLGCIREAVDDVL